MVFLRLNFFAGRIDGWCGEKGKSESCHHQGLNAFGD
jgi:hypothetical protein